MSQPPVYVQTPGYSQPIPAQYFEGPQPAYNYPGPPQGTATVIITQPTVGTTFTAIGQTPSRISCPSCRADILTTVKYEPSSKTHLIALCLFCFIGPVFAVPLGDDNTDIKLRLVLTHPNCWPCVCLPYCMDSCQNANHYCPNCNAFIGTYQS